MDYLEKKCFDDFEEALSLHNPTDLCPRVDLDLFDHRTFFLHLRSDPEKTAPSSCISVGAAAGWPHSVPVSKLFQKHQICGPSFTADHRWIYDWTVASGAELLKQWAQLEEDDVKQDGGECCTLYYSGIIICQQQNKLRCGKKSEYEL